MYFKCKPNKTNKHNKQFSNKTDHVVHTVSFRRK